MLAFLGVYIGEAFACVYLPARALLVATPRQSQLRAGRSFRRRGIP